MADLADLERSLRLASPSACIEGNIRMQLRGRGITVTQGEGEFCGGKLSRQFVSYLNR